MFGDNFEHQHHSILGQERQQQLVRGLGEVDAHLVGAVQRGHLVRVQMLKCTAVGELVDLSGRARAMDMLYAKNGSMAGERVGESAINRGERPRTSLACSARCARLCRAMNWAASCGKPRNTSSRNECTKSGYRIDTISSCATIKAIERERARE